MCAPDGIFCCTCGVHCDTAPAIAWLGPPGAVPSRRTDGMMAGNGRRDRFACGPTLALVCLVARGRSRSSRRRSSSVVRNDEGSTSRGRTCSTSSTKTFVFMPRGRSVARRRRRERSCSTHRRSSHPARSGDLQHVPRRACAGCCAGEGRRCWCVGDRIMAAETRLYDVRGREDACSAATSRASSSTAPATS